MAKNDKYKKGSILKFENDKIDTVIVIGETIYNDIQYILVAPYKIVDEETVVTDKTKIVLLNVSDDDNLSIELNPDIVNFVVQDILSKPNIVSY